MSWLVISTDKSQLYSIVRREASCFVNLNAPYCFLPRQVIPWRVFAFLIQILCIILSLFLIWWERVRIQYGYSNGESERISVCNINCYLYSTDCVESFQKDFNEQQPWKNFDKVHQYFMIVATVDTDFTY